MFFRFYYKIKMGKTRNHGGTGGHGYFPLPGERPNYNHHVMDDKELVSFFLFKKLTKGHTKMRREGHTKKNNQAHT